MKLLIVLALTSVAHADDDFSWQSGAPRSNSVLGNQYVTGELRLDDVFHYDLHHPADDTIVGSTEAWRSGENQVTQLGIGGDFHWDNVQVRLMTQFGMLSTTTPRNDASPARGQWNLDNAYRYLSEAYGGYHAGRFNLQAGLFMSYIGLWSYYNFDNWTYQPSFVSSNTPWFFNGVRLQWFPTDRLKIEPWLINGWQSYGRLNSSPGLGGQVRYTPSSNVILIANQYVYGTDILGAPERKRFHTDDSVQVLIAMKLLQGSPCQMMTYDAERTKKAMTLAMHLGGSWVEKGKGTDSSLRQIVLLPPPPR